jgi:hypothetical protein
MRPQSSRLSVGIPNGRRDRMIVMSEAPNGSEQNPIKADREQFTCAEIEFGDRPWLWVVTPGGQLVKCYRSYADYCFD